MIAAREPEYNGYTNWATWNAALWADNEYEVYRCRMRTQPRTEKELQVWFAVWFPGGLTPDMDEGDQWDIDWTDLLEHWEEEYDDFA